MSLGEIWRYYRYRFALRGNKLSNKYIEQQRKPLCDFHSAENYMLWMESFADRISKSQGRKQIGLNTRRKGE